jgi:hypothetical protein
MDLASVREYLEPLRTENVLARLRETNVGDLIYNPWFLAGLGIFCIVALVLRRQALVLMVMTVLAYACLIDYALQKKPAVESIGSTPVLIFAGGGAGLLFVLIYFLFIRHD